MNISDQHTLDGVTYAMTLSNGVVEVRSTTPGGAVLTGAQFDAKTRTVGGGSWDPDPGSNTRRALYRWATNAIRIRLGGTLLA
jgi:hypothetical protein